MKHTLLFFLTLVFGLHGVPVKLLALAPQATEAPMGFLESQNPNTKEEEVYASAKDALDQGEYEDAAKTFGEVAKMRSRRADAALYWRAYALNKVKRNSEALSTVDQLRKGYPQSQWLRDAGALEIEIRNAKGQQVDPGKESDEELKLYALNSLIDSDPEKAIHYLEKILQENSSLKLKDRALFVLSQSNSDKAQQILLNIAKGNNQPELQKHAVRWLGVNGSRRNSQVLQAIYESASTAEVKKSVLQAFMVGGDKERILAVARGEKSTELKKYAIQQLGVMGGGSELHQIYKETNDASVKEAVLEAFGISGDSKTLAEVAKSETDPKVRAHAIRALGIAGDSVASEALLAIYGR